MGTAGFHVDSSKEMSRAGAEWVIAPTATAATPVRAYSSTFPRWIPPDASRKTIRAEARDRLPDHRRRHVVEEDRVGPRRDRRLHVLKRLRLDLDAEEVVRRRTRRGHRRGDPPGRADPVLLDEDPVRKGEPVVRSAPHPDGVLLEDPEQRRRFPRVEQLRPVRGDPRSVEGRRGGHAREPLEEVEGHPLRPQEGTGRTGRTPDPVAAGHPAPVGGEGNGNGRVDLAEHLRRHRPAAQHPVTPRKEERPTRHPGTPLRRGRRTGRPRAGPRGRSPRTWCREITARYRLTSSRFFPSLAIFRSSVLSRSRRASTMSGGALAVNRAFPSCPAMRAYSAFVFSTSLRRRFSSCPKSMRPSRGRQTSMSFTTAVASFTGM